MGKKKCYFVKCNGEDVGFALVASSTSEAKKIGYPYVQENISCEWIDLRVKWMKDVKVDDLPIGYVFDEGKKALEGLFRGAYGWVESAKCPNCGAEDILVEEIHDDVFGCLNCEDKLTPKDINNPYKLN